MIAVIFEVRPFAEHADRYFDLAATLRPELARADGFISIERFESRTEAGKFLSLSFWRDRDAVDAWYENAEHRRAQTAGRAGIFAEYRIRVADVFRDYDMVAGRPGKQ